MLLSRTFKEAGLFRVSEEKHNKEVMYLELAVR